jgi:hypothetical protein
MVHGESPFKKLLTENAFFSKRFQKSAMKELICLFPQLDHCHNGLDIM